MTPRFEIDEHMADELRFLNAIDARIQRDLADEVWAAVRAVEQAPVLPDPPQLCPQRPPVWEAP